MRNTWTGGKPGRPKLADETKMLGVMLPTEMHARLRAVAKAQGRTTSAVVREVLAGFLARLERVLP